MKITIVDGPYKGQKFRSNSPVVTIGRDGGNQLILDTDGVSRCHAEIKQLPGGSWIVSDLNSTNGVKIDGKRIDGSAPLTEGTEIIIGENVLSLSDMSQEPARVIFNPIISAPPAKTELPELKESGALFQTPPPAAEAEKGEKTAPEESPKTVSGVDIKKLSGPLFGGKGRAGKDSSSSAAAPDSGNDTRKKRSNIIFYTVLACVVIMVLSSVFGYMNPDKGRKKGVQREQILDLKYEKEVYAKDNVFRFSFDLRTLRAKRKKDKAKSDPESNTPQSKYEYKVLFTIDDIASRRHYEREVPLSPESVEELRQVIRQSGIYASGGKASERDESVVRRLTVADGSRIFRTTAIGKFAAQEFEAVEDAVLTLTETFGVKAISMTPAELIEVAKKAFSSAEDLYANRRAGATNLRMAIKNYKVAVESLEQFSPKPPQWNEAREKLAEAVKEREMLIDALETEFKKLLHLRSFEAMKPIFRQMMDLTEPESPRYGVIKRRMIKIEQLLRKKRR